MNLNPITNSVYLNNQSAKTTSQSAKSPPQIDSSPSHKPDAIDRATPEGHLAKATPPRTALKSPRAIGTSSITPPTRTTQAEKLFSRELTWVVTTGTAGVGKGTLLEHVADTGHIVIPEAARQVLAKRDQQGSPRYDGLGEAIATIQAKWQENVSEAILKTPALLPQMFTNIAALTLLENTANRCANAGRNTGLSEAEQKTAALIALHLPRMRPLEDNLCAIPTPDSIAKAEFNKLSLSKALCQYLGLESEATPSDLYQTLIAQARAKGGDRYQAYTQLARDQKKTVFTDRGFLDPLAFLEDRSVLAATEVASREDRKKTSDAIGAQEPVLAKYTRATLDAAARHRNIQVLLVEPHAVSDAGLKALQDAQRHDSPDEIRQQQANLRQAYTPLNPTGIPGLDKDGQKVAPQLRAQQALAIARAHARPGYMRPTASSAAKARRLAP